MLGQRADIPERRAARKSVRALPGKDRGGKENGAAPGCASAATELATTDVVNSAVGVPDSFPGVGVATPGVGRSHSAAVWRWVPCTDAWIASGMPTLREIAGMLVEAGQPPQSPPRIASARSGTVVNAASSVSVG